MGNKYRKNNNKCISCKKSIDDRVNRCKSCAMKHAWKISSKLINRNTCGENSGNYIDGRTSTKHYCIDCKINEISYNSWRYGKQRCYSCAHKGENNPAFTTGITLKKYICIKCGKIISLNNFYYGLKRCKSCAHKGKLSARFGKLAPHGRGSYYKKIWMRSSYEIKYAKYLDKNRIKWLYESKTFDLGDTTYTPDFYLSETNIYIEIKGWWRDKAKEKFKLFRRLYSDLNIKVLYKLDLIKLGVLGE